MPDILTWPLWLIWFIPCAVTFLVLFPLWVWSISRRRIKSLRREVTLWRSEKLLQSQSPLDLEITGIQRKSWALRFVADQISYRGKKFNWTIPFGKIKQWRVFDQNAQPGFANSGPAILNLEVQDSDMRYRLDSDFVNDSEADDLIRAACVRAFGSNETTILQGLQMELARTERLLHEINSGNINRSK
jgi:hypothetical protein